MIKSSGSSELEEAWIGSNLGVSSVPFRRPNETPQLAKLASRLPALVWLTPFILWLSVVLPETAVAALINVDALDTV